MKTLDNIHHIGMYSIAEAAMFLGKEARMVRNWTRGYTSKWSGQREVYSGVILPQRTDDIEYPLGFFNLIELLLIFRLRETLSLQAIRKIYEDLKTYLQVEFPFACDKIYQDTNGDILAKIVKNVDGEEESVLVEIKNKQTLMHEIVKNELREILRFRNQYVSRWYPAKESSPLVILDPEYQFGLPIVKESKIQTKYLYDTYLRQKEDLEYVAWWHNVTLNEAKQAIMYEKGILGAA